MDILNETNRMLIGREFVGTLTIEGNILSEVARPREWMLSVSPVAEKLAPGTGT